MTAAEKRAVFGAEEASAEAKRTVRAARDMDWKGRAREWVGCMGI
jgi:hypothetical protein